MLRLPQSIIWILIALTALPQVAHARVYNPETGRWMQRDPAGYVDGSNQYEYVASNPTKYVDPTGLKLTVNGTGQFKKSVLKALNEMCPDGDFKLNSDGTVESQNEEFSDCNTEDAENPELCKCLQSAMNSDRDIRIERYLIDGEAANNDQWLPDDENDPWGDGAVQIGKGMKRQQSYPGRYDSVEDAKKIWPRNINKVPWNYATALAHELCAHAMDNLDHRNPDGSPRKDIYTETDPVIQRENEYREELGPGYGTRTGGN